MILLLGGTSDSLAIAQALTELGAPFCLSVVSDYGAALARQEASEVLQGRLDAAAMSQVIQERYIKLVIDGTHPFATEVSETAMAVCQQLNIPYLRFERPSYLPAEVIVVDSIEAACQKAQGFQGKIYLTTGSKNLAQFLQYLPPERVVARVLPTAEVLQLTEQLGLTAGQVEAVKGPFSEAVNVALMKHSQVAVMITKESGAAGGFMEKVQACRQLGLPCIVIQRKQLGYPMVFETITALISQVKEQQHGR